LVTSILCVAEFFGGARTLEASFLKNWIQSDELDLLYVDSVEDAIRAWEIRKRYRLTLPDSLILAAAKRHRASFLTHDHDFLNKARHVVRAQDPLEF